MSASCTWTISANSPWCRRSRTSPRPSAKPYVPGWFAALVRPQLAGRAVRVVTAEQANPIVIVGEPSDEIAEAWQDFSVARHRVALAQCADPRHSLCRARPGARSARASLQGHAQSRGRSLRHAARAAEGEGACRHHRTLQHACRRARYGARREQPALSPAHHRAGEERREIANELHDEAGPCLFGITANASSIQNLADQLPDERTAEISRRVGEILSIAERLKTMNRALLKKLRPGPLGRVKLAELLKELVAGFERRHPDTHILITVGKLADLLWGGDRSHALSLHPGEHHQRHPPWQGGQHRHRSRRGAGVRPRRRQAASDPAVA